MFLMYTQVLSFARRPGCTDLSGGGCGARGGLVPSRAGDGGEAQEVIGLHSRMDNTRGWIACRVNLRAASVPQGCAAGAGRHADR